MTSKRKLYATVSLILGIVIMVNILSREFHVRLDLTEGRQYTLSQATRDMLRGLDEPVTVKAYFSKNLPPNIEKARKDFQDLLAEYSNLSKQMVQYAFTNPNESETAEQEAQEKGIRPVVIDVREKDQMKQQKAYLGAIVELGEKQEVIPFLQPGSAMEYALSTAIKKLSVINKPVIGLVQGQGEPLPEEMGQLNQQLQVLYQTQAVNLTDSTDIPPNIHTLAIIRPTEPFHPDQLEKLDSFLSQGGKMVIALNRVQGNLQRGQISPVNTGLDTWLAGKGLRIADNCVIDAQCGTIPIQQRAGFFTIQTNVTLPYLPMISNFANHPVTAGLENMVLEFPSTISYQGTRAHYTPLVFTSAIADSQTAPLFVDIKKQWTQKDFHTGHLPVAAALEGNLETNGLATKMVIIADGNFIINGPPQQGGNRQLTPDNVNFLSNAIDWLTDNTELIGLRTKLITSRPLREIEDSTRTLVKYFNFLFPVLLAIAYGLYRARRNRQIRQQRMTESIN